MNQDRTTRRQATAIELSALLVECVCVPGPGEQQAVGLLATALNVGPEAIAEELLYLRAFAVDFAVLMSLGDTPAKDQILALYYEHWQRLDQEVEGARAALEERLQAYAAVVGDVTPGQGGLARQLGIALAARINGEGQAPGELMVFGARLFAALYDEVRNLLTEIDILPLDE